MQKTVRLFAALIVVVMAFFLALFGYARWGNSWQGSAKTKIGLFSAEEDAAYEGSTNIQTNPAIAQIQSGEAVSVLWDTYGKDYWACYIRVASGKRGWVLCTSLTQQV